MKKEEKKVAKKVVKNKMSARQGRLITVLTLIDVINTKVTTLKHGYIADDEFAELRRLVQKI